MPGKSDKREGKQRRKEALRQEKAKRAYNKFETFMIEIMTKNQKLRKEALVSQASKELMLGRAEVVGDFVKLRSEGREKNVNVADLTTQLRTLINKYSQLKENYQTLVDEASALKENHWNYLGYAERNILSELVPEYTRRITKYGEEIHDYSLALTQIIHGEKGN